MLNSDQKNGQTSSSSKQDNSKLVLAILSTVPILMVLGNSMLIPEFPKIKAALNITQFQVGLLITLFSGSASLAIPILGFLSDQYRRKTIIIPSLIVYGLGGVISGLGATIFAKSYLIILIGRVIQGIGAAGTAPIVMAMVGDLYPDNRSEAMGVIEAANGTGKVLSPVLGALLAIISWWALFFFYAFLVIPITIGVLFFTKEPSKNHRKETAKEYFTSIAQIFHKIGSSLIACLLAGMTVLSLLFGVLAHISDVLENDYQLQGLIKGLIIAIPILFMSISSFSTGRFLKQQGKNFKLTTITGLIITSLSLGLLPFFDNPYFYVGCLTLMGVGVGFVLTTVNTLITSSTSRKQRGGITSLYGCVRFLGVAIGPPVFSLLLTINEKVMFFTGSIFALLIAGFILIFLHEQKLLDEKSS